MEMMGRPSESTSTDSGVVIEESVLFKGGEEGNINISMNNNINSVNNSLKIDTNVNNNMKSDDNSAENTNETRHSPGSVHSTHISIESLEDDDDSSVIDSDSDIDEIPRNGDFIIQKLGQHAADAGSNGIVVISQSTNENPICTNGISEKPQIGTIAVQNSTDITFGSKTFYQGPVTIKQFLLDKDKWKRSPNDGNINPGFDSSDTASRTKFSEYKTGDELKPEKFSVKKKAAGITAIVLLVTIILTAVSITTFNALNNKAFNPDDDDGNKHGLQLIARNSWEAKHPTGDLTDLDIPAKRVIIAHTATEPCSTEKCCIHRTQVIQKFHMNSRKWDDIAYNFLVGGDGSVYEGRGWDKQGAHTRGFNVNSICIAFIGTFIREPPPKKQLQAAQLILAEGLKLHKLAPDYKLYGHRQLIPTESPGEPLYKIIKTWEHWSDDVGQIKSNK